ncbi:MAG: acyl-phosphate glycerol 3-phosphate acyltransferase [Desulfuromonas sp.]|nr:MAG: acyl-phosphate glycerol 3-phosphate acyltransferase [Desulfuromonas sp.]
MTLIFLIPAAYLIGAIPTGVLLTRLTGSADIRNAGSGNIGATNVYRVAGRTLGLLTLIGDCLKGVLPLLLTAQFYSADHTVLAQIAIAAFVGHCYPIYLRFKGGKGVATALGIFLVLSPLSVLCALGLFIVVLWGWRYISLASISAAALIPFLILSFEQSTSLFSATLLIAAIIIWRHRANIERLRAGTESRFSL